MYTYGHTHTHTCISKYLSQQQGQAMASPSTQDAIDNMHHAELYGRVSGRLSVLGYGATQDGTTWGPLDMGHSVPLKQFLNFTLFER